MRYLLLIYDNEARYAELPPTEGDAELAEYKAFTDRLDAAGQNIVSEALHPPNTATTVRIRDGRTVTTDGPFAETKEQLGGFYLVEAKDLDEAIGLAAQIPAVKTGCVEVRPVMELDL